VSSLDRILSFLKPIEDLLVDPAITEVMVNDGGRYVFVEREGGIEAVPDRTLESRNLTVAIKNIARACGDEISDVQPLPDARLEDGSRVAAVFPPCAVIHQAGCRAVVALMGSTLSRHQADLLCRHFDRVLVMLDGDEAGRQGTAAIVSTLTSRVR
jgi:hypothetical protein